ncbi:uncharacterized protein LOC117639330 isoform X2 [Thrips palmi]|uniref:Uncharacterized protein LOC117639330 isoform X2 n=1 Tax=Thrips palmi TaxID=161013 RepID=A0A6P8Y386_THRPL|nr:uncharacterized protein LOC117639330 isoform X2 [Thrips palmi]
MADDPDFSFCLEDSTNELLKHEKMSAKNTAVLLKNHEIAYQLVTDFVNVSKNEKHLGESLTHIRKLEREKDLLETKIRRGEEITAELREESSNLRSQLLDKQNEVPLLAQDGEMLKEKLRELLIDENVVKTEKEQQHNSVILTKDQYKKFVGCHIRLLERDDHGHTYIFKFENSPPGSTETLPPKSAKVYQSLKKEWKLLETNPILPNFELLSKTLSETQDIQGLLRLLNTTLKQQAKQHSKGREI